MDTQITVTPEFLRPSLHILLRQWPRPEGPALQFWAGLRLVQAHLPRPDSTDEQVWQAVQTVIQEGIGRLAHHSRADATLLQRRFLQAVPDTAQAIALDVGLSVDSVNRQQRQAIEQLAAILADQETAVRQAAVSEMENRLPAPTYSRLFGQTEARAQLLDMLAASQTPWINCITGLGGLGKTALADSAARHLIRQSLFHQVIWVRVEAKTMHGRHASPAQVWQQVRQGVFDALQGGQAPPAQQETFIRQRLKTWPSLVIIDNLEEETAVILLLEKLAAWAEPSRFLLTSRAFPGGPHPTRPLALNELSQADSLALVRHEAEQRGLEEVVGADDEQLQPIYALTGGNPLALKLVIGQAQSLPLPQILNDLAQSRQAPTQHLYTHIYWHAWQNLSQHGRVLLEAMPLIGDSGALPPQMQAMSGLDEDQLWGAIRELVSRSLLEVRGDAWERRYGIHRLTETFLQTEIIHWPLDNADDAADASLNE